MVIWTVFFCFGQKFSILNVGIESLIISTFKKYVFIVRYSYIMRNYGKKIKLFHVLGFLKHITKNDS